MEVEVTDIFDVREKAESAWPYRAVNFLHIRTRDQIIRRELLLRRDQTTTRALLAESERNLRALPFIKSARIEPVPVGPNTADLRVFVQDSWTTQPQVNFGSEGGESSMSAGIEEENFLGLGKTLSVFYRDENFEKQGEIGYKDRQLFGTRWRLDTTLKTMTTGNGQNVSLLHPFYSVTTRYSYGVSIDRFRQLQRIFQGGVETSRYDQHHRAHQLRFGIRLNRNPLTANRLQIDWKHSEDDYVAQPQTAPGTLPEQKIVNGPLLTWSREPTDFIKESFIEKAGRVEDFNLGHQIKTNSGFSGRALGATEDSIPLGFTHEFGLEQGPRVFQLFSYGINGRYTMPPNQVHGGRMRDTLYYATGNAYVSGGKEWPRVHTFHAEGAWQQNPDISNEIELGGNTGLRGFKNRSFTGNKSILMNWESRVFYPDEVLRVVYLGGAIFADMGQAQPEGQGFRYQDFHANVGLGLRFGLSRSSAGNIYRFDVAYALGPVPGDGSRVIVSISTGPGFKRGINTIPESK